MRGDRPGLFHDFESRLAFRDHDGLTGGDVFEDLSRAARWPDDRQLRDVAGFTKSEKLDQ